MMGGTKDTGNGIRVSGNGNGMARVIQPPFFRRELINNRIENSGETHLDLFFARIFWREFCWIGMVRRGKLLLWG